MELKSTCSCSDLFNEACGRARVALTEDPEIHWKGISRLKYPLNMPRARRAGCGIRARGGSSASAHHRGQTGKQRFRDLLRADEMDVYIDAAGRDDLSFASDRFRARSDDNIYIRLNIRVSSLADCRNMAIFNADISFYDSPVVENQSVGNDGINRSVRSGTLRLAHAVAHNLPASELQLLSIDCEVLLHLDNQVGIGETHLVANSRTKHLRIRGAVHCVWHFDYLTDPMTRWVNP